MRKAPATSGGASPRATLRAGPENNGRPRRLAFQVRGLTGGEPGGRACGNAEKHLSPAGNGREGSGALHGVANEAQVLKHLGGGARWRRGTLRDRAGLGRMVKAPEAMRPRVEHVEIIMVGL